MHGMLSVKEYDPETMLNVIRSTWAFKCKRYPDGLIKKFKARFCARGDMQLEGVDFFETYADIGAMVSYIFTYRDSRTIRMLGCDV